MLLFVITWGKNTLKSFDGLECQLKYIAWNLETTQMFTEKALDGILYSNEDGQMKTTLNNTKSGKSIPQESGRWFSLQSKAGLWYEGASGDWPCSIS